MCRLFSAFLQATIKLVCQLVALDLAGFRHGNSVDELDVLRTQALSYADGVKVFRDGIKRGRDIAGFHDEGADALAQAIIRQADGGMGANARAAVQVVVHFICGDVDAAANEDFLLAAVDLYAAFFVLNAQVAREEPAVVIQVFRGCFRVLQIAAEHMRPAGDFFALGAVRHFVAVLVDNFDLDALKGNARPVAIPFQTMLGGTARWGQLSVEP